MPAICVGCPVTDEGTRDPFGAITVVGKAPLTYMDGVTCAGLVCPELTLFIITGITVVVLGALDSPALDDVLEDSSLPPILMLLKLDAEFRECFLQMLRR